MGLEAATFVSQLVATNPIATDKKNQGDDHLRLMKSVLQSTFPNASKPFYAPDITSKSANYVMDVSDGGKVFFVNTSGGAVTLTLPNNVTFAGWQVSVFKVTADANPVYVAPPSGTINGYGKIRCNTLNDEYRFISGSVANTYVYLRPPGIVQPGVLEWYAGPNPPVGYAVAGGNSLLRADHPELFAAWGTQWGAADGTHFSSPTTFQRFFVALDGVAYNLGSTGGEATHTLTIGEMPTHQPAGTTQLSTIPHTHQSQGSILGIGYQPGGNNLFLQQNAGTTTTGQPDGNPAHLHNFTCDAIGGSNAHENRPPYIGLYSIFRLC